jgi:hypothetical protein
MASAKMFYFQLPSIFSSMYSVYSCFRARECKDRVRGCCGGDRKKWGLLMECSEYSNIIVVVLPFECQRL